MGMSINEDRAVLVGAGETRHVEELGRLATTLGMEVSGVLEQNRRDGTGYLGRGKREELRGLVGDLEASFVVADDELTASQARVLEKAAGATVVDRMELIIRIFEAHARDAASRLEVELADLEYRLPRVKGRNPELSRLGGGTVLARGPGEQQLEYDRRAIRRRMQGPYAGRGSRRRARRPSRSWATPTPARRLSSTR
jgi:GTP-binding protein HflX